MGECQERTKRVMVIYYSTYGHTETLAREIASGLNSVKGIKAELWRVPETLNEGVLKSMGAKPQPNDVPVLSYDKLSGLETADGLIFGTPTRFGVMSAQMKVFFDSTGGLSSKGGLSGKPAGFFFSTGTQGVAKKPLR